MSSASSEDSSNYTPSSSSPNATQQDSQQGKATDRSSSNSSPSPGSSSKPSTRLEQSYAGPLPPADDDHICRVCRCEGTPEQPLFHPCKCAGSIKFVHQDCLTQWLTTSRKKSCEVCGHEFHFTPIFAPNMPKRVPVPLLVRKACLRIVNGLQRWLRMLVVVFSWLILVPYLILIVWRLLFYLAGSWSSASRLGIPISDGSILHSFPLFRLLSAALTSVVSNDTSRALLRGLYSRMPVWAQAFASEWMLDSLARTLLYDVVEGQIITIVSLFFAVGMFMVREVVMEAGQQLLADEQRVRRNRDGHRRDRANVDLQRRRAPQRRPPSPPPARHARIQAVVPQAPTVARDSREHHQVPRPESSQRRQPESPTDQENVRRAFSPSSPGNVFPMESRMPPFSESKEAFRSPPEARPPVDLMRDEIGKTFGRLDDLSSINFASGHAMASASTSRSLNAPRRRQKLHLRTLTDVSEGSPVRTRPSESLSHNEEPGRTRRKFHRVLAPGDQPDSPDSTSLRRRSKGKCVQKVPDIPEAGSSAFASTTAAKPHPVIQTPFSQNHRSSDTLAPERVLAAREGTSNEPKSASSAALNGMEVLGTLSTAYTNSPHSMPPPHNMGLPVMDSHSLQGAGPQMVESDSVTQTTLTKRTELSGGNPLRFHKQTQTDPQDLEAALALQARSGRAHEAVGGDDENLQPIGHEPAAAIHAGNPRDVVDNQGEVVPPAGGELVEGQQVQNQGLLDQPDAEDLDGLLEVMGFRGPFFSFLHTCLVVLLSLSAVVFITQFVPYLIGKALILTRPWSYIGSALSVVQGLADAVSDFILDKVLPETLKNALIGVAQPANSMLALPEASGSVYWHGSTLHLNSAFDVCQAALRYLVVRAEHVRGWLVGLFPNLDAVADGQTWVDRLTCMLIGYALAAVPVLYAIALSSFHTVEGGARDDGQLPAHHNAYIRVIRRSAQHVLNFIRIITKVLFFVVIDLVIFPTFCGILLDICTLPVFNGATLESRLAFHDNAPVTSWFLHWFAGTCFMFHFAVFVSLCREIVRPGVMWFIRDPNDPHFYPLREMIDRPVKTQLKKILIILVLYSVIVVVVVGGVVYGVENLAFITAKFIQSSMALLGKDIGLQSNIRDGIIFPLDFSFSGGHAIGGIPLDLLLFHFLFPSAINRARPKRYFKKLLGNWFKLASKALLLTSFMFGGRHADEEDQDDALDEDEENLEIMWKEVGGSRGGLMRVPAHDAVPIQAGRRIFLATDQLGQIVVPGIDTNDDDPTHWTIAYIPSRFRKRVGIFLLSLLLSGAVFGALVAVAPIVVGRLMAKIVFRRHGRIQDIYAIAVGLPTLWLIAFLWAKLRKLLKVARASIEAETLRHGADVGAGHMLRLYGRVFLPSLSSRSLSLFCTWAIVFLKLTYVLALFGLVLPLAISSATNHFVVAPIEVFLGNRIPHNAWQEWALGMIYENITYQVLQASPQHRWTQAWRHMIQNGWRDLQLQRVTRVIVLPTLAILGLSHAVPFVAGISVCQTAAWLPTLWPGETVPKILHAFNHFASDPFNSTTILRLSYPICLLMLILGLLAKAIYSGLRSWMKNVRDEEYMVGQILNNHLPGQRQPMPGPSQSLPRVVDQPA